MKNRVIYGVGRSLALFICAIGLSVTAYAQATLQVNGRIKIEGGDVQGSRAVVYKNGVKERTITTDLNKFSVVMDVNSTYIISFEKNGYVSKKLSFNTTVPSDAPTKDFLPFDFAVSLFQQYDDINIVVFNQPVGIIRYEPSMGDFDYDTDYTKSIQSQLQAVLDQVEERQNEEAKQAVDQQKEKAQQAKELAKAEAAAKRQEEANVKALANAEEEHKAQLAEAEAQRKEQEKRDAEALMKKKAEEQAALRVEPIKEEKPEPIAAAKPEPIPVQKRPEPLVQHNTSLANVNSGTENRRSIAATSGLSENAVRPAREVPRMEQNDVPEHLRPVTVRNEDLIVEPSKVIKLITYETAGVETEYRKVTHKWGGVFYFKSGVSCSQEIFDRETFEEADEQIAGATRSR
ncbi:MAG: hypothetical protein IPI00_04575 [Flavobacteriales bacterium]|nr:hypothetical protein [Flavobacteriales bacterium]MBK6945100.1 hypothetical protein [Flavobacteriales bacterium]MBK7239449.1 hypothetical protein [Flavobacteriales bacterium]MBK9535343.1 hypothetical protein [Flavobacteriales bacterium]MBP9137552.1 hypothetical protein [Flavobacteriales bacterium]